MYIYVHVCSYYCFWICLQPTELHVYLGGLVGRLPGLHVHVLCMCCPGCALQLCMFCWSKRHGSSCMNTLYMSVA